MGNQRNQNPEKTTDLVELFFMLVKRIKLIILITLIGAAIGFGYSELFITPLYQANAMIIVSNNTTELQSNSISSEQMSASSNLADTYAIIVTSDNVIDEVKANIGLNDEQYNKVIDSVNVSAVNGTQVMQIRVTSTDPQTALSVCSEIIKVSPTVIIDVMGAGSVKVLSDAAMVDGGNKVSPNVTKNTVMGGGIALVLICILISVVSILNNKIRNEDDIREQGMSVLGMIPIWHRVADSMFHKKENSIEEERVCHLITDETASFAFVEAYKSLRTNVDFIAKKGNIKSILVTSMEPRDGKSSVSMNLAVALGDAGKKVILVDGDLRKGTLATYLKTGRNHRGLTNVMSEEQGGKGVIVRLPEQKIDFLPVGMIPPNPAELLASHKMFDVLQTLSRTYDYIIIDTPPVNIVTDAAILSSMTDGVILVARANETPKQFLALAKSKLDDVNANILGVVLNEFDMQKTSYYYKHGYNYGYYHDSGYGTKHKNKAKLTKRQKDESDPRTANSGRGT